MLMQCTCIVIQTSFLCSRYGGEDKYNSVFFVEIVRMLKEFTVSLHPS